MKLAQRILNRRPPTLTSHRPESQDLTEAKCAADELRSRLMKTKTIEQLQEIHELAELKRKHPGHAFSEPQQRAIGANPANILGIGVGKNANRHAVRVYVFAQLSDSLTPHDLRPPQEVAGIPVEVIRTDPFEVFTPSNGHPPVSTKALTTTLRPGSSISSAEIKEAGSVGYFCRQSENGPVLVLTAHHVIFRPGGFNTAKMGDDILSPGTLDNGTSPANLVAKFGAAIPVNPAPTSFTPGSENRADAAIAQLAEGIDYDLRIEGAGWVGELGRARIGDKVAKRGRTTGYTRGTIKDVHFSYDLLCQVNGSHQICRFTGLILIERSAKLKTADRPFMLGGDSGSLLVSLTDDPGASNEGEVSAIGLLFLGSQDGANAVACPIGNVLNGLKVQLLTAR